MFFYIKKYFLFIFLGAAVYDIFLRARCISQETQYEIFKITLYGLNIFFNIISFVKRVGWKCWWLFNLTNIFVKKTYYWLGVLNFFGAIATSFSGGCTAGIDKSSILYTLVHQRIFCKYSFKFPKSLSLILFTMYDLKILFNIISSCIRWGWKCWWFFNWTGISVKKICYQLILCQLSFQTIYANYHSKPFNED